MEGWREVTDLKIVDFPVQVSLADIPGRLRQLADEMERRPHEETMPLTFVFVEGYEDGEVKVGCFGDCPSKWEVVGLLELASRHFTPDEGDIKRRGGS
jgi:hypothetical protein